MCGRCISREGGISFQWETVSKRKKRGDLQILRQNLRGLLIPLTLEHTHSVTAQDNDCFRLFIFYSQGLSLSMHFCEVLFINTIAVFLVSSVLCGIRTSIVAP